MNVPTHGRHAAPLRPARPGDHRLLAAAGFLAAAGALVSVSGVSAAGHAGDAGATASPTVAACGDPGDTAPVNDGFPQRLSSLVGADIRTGEHECFERVVLELQGEGELPGYLVRYEPDPILDSPRGEPVDVAGDATLVVSVGVWMTSPDDGGYAGPTELVPTNVANIRELEMLENFEGMTSWAIGLDRERDFTVSTLEDPVRIVVDIARDVPSPLTPGTTTAGGSPSPAPQIPPTRSRPMPADVPCRPTWGDPVGSRCPMGPMS